MDKSFDGLIDSYLASGVGRTANFIGQELSAKLIQNFQALKAADQFHIAGISNDSALQVNTTIRRDKIYWLDRNNKNIDEDLFFEHIDRFVQYLNETCYAGIASYEFHYAIYEPGAFYKRHLDQFKTNKKRAFSLIMYLNENWQAGDGGELVVYLHDEDVVIQPIGGTCVFFKSKELEHEVLTCNKQRMSITGWLKTN